MDNLLEIKHLYKNYNSLNGEVKAIHNLSLSVKDGEFLCIIGPSGCGKSTILNILAGLDKDYKGSVVYKEGTTSSYMTQEDALFPWLTVFDNACIGLKVQNKLTEVNKQYVHYLLDKYGLKDFKDTKITNLSGGMRQRVALIRTIATKPKLVFLDEPFSALDYVSRLKVSDDIYRILKEEGITCIMVTHDIAESISLSDRIVVLSKRPSRIKNIYEIDLSGKSNPIDNRKSPDFSKYYEVLWKDIDDNE